MYGASKPLAPLAPSPEQELAAALAQLSAQHQAAQQGAAQAGQDYTQAAQQPVPQLNPMSELVGSLLPNIASVLSGNQRYAQEGKQNLDERRADLLLKRQAQLKSLSDVYDQKAEAAQKLGDLDTEMKFKQLSARMTEQQQKIIEQMRGQTALDEMNNRNKGALDLEALRQSGNIKEIAAKRDADIAVNAAKAKAEGAATTPEDVSTFAHSVAKFQSKLSDYDQPTRKAIVKYAAENKLKFVPLQARKVVDAISGARTTIEQLSTLSSKIHTAKNPAERGKQTVGNVVNAVTQERPEIEEYRAVAEGMLASLSRGVGGEKGNLSNVDIKRAKSMVPRLVPPDSETVAKNKLKNLVAYMDTLENRTLETYTTELGSSQAEDPLGIR